MHYVYVLQCGDGKLYIGQTADLCRRLNEHQSGHSRSTKYRRPMRLVYYEAYASEKDAYRREAMLKLHKKAFAQLKNRLGESFTWVPKVGDQGEIDDKG